MSAKDVDKKKSARPTRKAAEACKKAIAKKLEEEQQNPQLRLKNQRQDDVEDEGEWNDEDLEHAEKDVLESEEEAEAENQGMDDDVEED